MTAYQKIRIENIDYLIIDSIQDFRAEDSFILPKNKLEQFDGHGEAKKHIGTYVGEKGKAISTFFNYHDWGKFHIDPQKRRKNIISARANNAVVQDGTCFFSKANLLKYLEDAKAEYYEQEQIYHSDISQYYNERYEAVKNLKDDHIFFTIYDASDNQSARQNRGYIRSDDYIWSLWRELILPKISYLSILKLIPEKTNTTVSKPIYYFRILLDYQFRTFVHPSSQISEQKPLAKKESSKKYRLGQDKYRQGVLEHMAQCPFTLITDERLLIASHIKPYNACMKENREDQALDYLNGLTLSPTYDKLFDQGFITFSNKGELICGTQLSALTWQKLNINPNAKNKMKIFPENREHYLEYHRKHVFQDDLEDLL